MHAAAIAAAEIATLGVIFVTALVANLLVLTALVLRSRRRRLSRLHFFILHLCLADLVNALLNVLPQLVWKATFRFVGGSVLCKLVKFGQTLGPHLTAFILVATLWDRTRAICYPLSYCRSSKRPRTMIATSWALALVLSMPQVTIFSFHLVTPTVRDCWASYREPWGERVYVTWYGVSVLLLPGALMLGTAWQLVGHVVRRQRALVSRAKVNTVRHTVTLVAVYLLCTAPFICLLLWAAWDRQAHSSPLWTSSALTLLTLLSSLNSCVNPWLHLLLSPELRDVTRRGADRTVCCLILGASA